LASNLQKILIYSPNWIGDAVMATPMVRETRRIFPESHLTVFARDWVSPVYRYVDGIDKIMTFSRAQRKDYSARQKLIERIQDQNFDVVLLLPDSFSTAWLMYRSGISRRIGYTGQFRSWMLTDQIPLKSGRSLHRSDKYINMLQSFEPDLNFGQSPQLELTNSEDFSVPKGWQVDKFHIGINPFSVATSRRWPQRYWQTLIDSLADDFVQFVMFGGPNDTEAAAQIVDGLKTQILVLTGKTSLEESIQLISKCDLFISNDSGPMHIADAAGVPTLGFWGAGDTSETGLRSRISKNLNADVYCSPCRKNQCINKKEPLICLHSLPPEMVLAEVQYFLDHQEFRG